MKGKVVMTTVTDEKLAKVLRNLHDVEERILKGSLDPDDLVRVLGHLIGKGERGRHLIEYSNANCPKVDYTTPVPKAKARPKKAVTKSDPNQGTLTVTKQPLADAIKAGQYAWANPDITEARFAIGDDQEGVWEFKIFDFGRDISSGDVIAQMKNDGGFLPAQSGHTLAYGALHPETQRKRPVIGLGSAAHVNGRRSVLVLDGGGARRRLNLDWYDFDWHERCLFLGVRRRSGT